MDPKAGCIEFVPQSSSLDQILSLNLQGLAVNRLIASAAGSYIASYVLGVRDRHYENILVRQDGLLFHIDFGNVLGNRVTIDTSSVAFTPSLQSVMGDQWFDFIDSCVEAFAVLRKYHLLLAPLAGRLFSSIAVATPDSVMEFFQQYLFLDLDEKSSRERFRAKLIKAPKSFKTRLKNIVHEMKVTIDKPLNSGNSSPISSPEPSNSSFGIPMSGSFNMRWTRERTDSEDSLDSSGGSNNTGTNSGKKTGTFRNFFNVNKIKNALFSTASAK